MSTKDPNMKIIFGSDTKDFEKGAKEVKQSLKDLDKTSASAFAGLGSAFGVNTGKIEQMASAVKGLGMKMSECGNAGVAAFGNIVKAIGPASVAIAGLGIAGAVAEFKNLNAEADAFKNTVAGANIEMATAAYVDTFRQTLRDFNQGTGKGLANFGAEVKKTFGEFKAVISDFFASGKILNPVGNAQGSAEQYRVAGANAERAKQLTDDIYDLERKRKEQAVELARLSADISDKMLIAKDASRTTAERQAAMADIEDKLAQKRVMTVDLENKLAVLYQERSRLASDSVAAADATLAQQVRAFEVDRSLNQETANLLRIKNSIGKATDAEIARMNKLIEQQKKLQQEIDAVHQKWAWVSPVSGAAGKDLALPGVTAPSMTILPRKEDTDRFREVFTAQLGEIRVGIGFKADTQKIQDITNEVRSLVESMATRVGDVIGSLVGTLVGGGDAWGDFKNAALSAFGDMAIAIGKIAISAGLASSGIAAALKNPTNWMLAVAAGAALVALGSAVKSSLSSVASGDYSAGGGGYSSGGYSPSSGDYETREVKVYVTGTLEADGDKLITVINNANRKDYYTK